jgi:hypothetical protein
MNRRSLFAKASLFASALFCVGIFTLGCKSEDEVVREMQMNSQRQVMRSEEQDHLGEAFSFLVRLTELNPEQANRQILFHLNRWLEDRREPNDSRKLPEVFATLDSAIDLKELESRFMSASFIENDIRYLRDQYLMQKMVSWIDAPLHDDPILEPWFQSLNAKADSGVDGSLKPDEVRSLQSASRLFDWTIRNVGYEPRELPSQITPPELPNDLEFLGQGYRQTTYQAIFRGRGDGLQRMNVFVQLCRQAQIPAVVIARNPPNSSDSIPWAVGVLIGGEAYLFECEVGIFIPAVGDEAAIATLKEARRDAQVLRRMKVPGFFDYPVAKSDLSSCVALVPASPEIVSDRFQVLQKSLTGDRRMVAAIDLEKMVSEIDQISGISLVRLWDMPLRAEQYEAAMERAADRDSQVALFHRGQWLMLDPSIPASRMLSMGRWQQLSGTFDDDPAQSIKGSRSYFLEQRQPEFEIADLRTDVELQQKYDVRRQLGMKNEEHDRMIEVVQGLIRATKRTATYWISMVQYEDGLYDNAQNWMEKRVLDDDQAFIWGQAAQYNLARTAEKLGQIDRAIELHKVRGLPTEHGSRLRARLLAKEPQVD